MAKIAPVPAGLVVDSPRATRAISEIGAVAHEPEAAPRMDVVGSLTARVRKLPAAGLTNSPADGSVMARTVIVEPVSVPTAVANAATVA